MSPHQVIAVGIRLFAIWLAVSVLRTVPTLYFAGHASHPGALAAAVFFLLSGLAILFLWFFPRTVATKLLSSPVVEPAPPATPDLWLAMGCALIGLWMLGYAVPAAIHDVVELHFANDNYDDTGGIKSWLVYNCMEIVIGLWLVCGARGIRKLFWWARNTGIK